MSSSPAYIKRGEEVVAVTLYMGTSDILHCKLLPPGSDPFVLKNVYGYPPNTSCVCGSEPARLVVHNTYGGEDTWNVLACLRCMVLTDSGLREDRSFGDFDFRYEHAWDPE